MKGMRKIVTAAGWIVVSALSMLSAQPSPAQIETKSSSDRKHKSTRGNEQKFSRLSKF